MSPFALSFHLETAGWARLTIRAEGRDFEIGSFGYCTDALGDLVRAALAMATGGEEARVIFDGEPNLWGLWIGEGWKSDRQPPLLRFLVSEADGVKEGRLPVEEWPHELLSTHLTADDFGLAAARAARSVLDGFGEEGYLERWVEHPFPTRALMALEAALGVPASTPRL